jgi:hypothetical protein
VTKVPEQDADGPAADSLNNGTDLCRWGGLSLGVSEHVVFTSNLWQFQWENDGPCDFQYHDDDPGPISPKPQGPNPTLALIISLTMVNQWFLEKHFHGFDGFRYFPLLIYGKHMAVCQNLVPLVNIKIAGKWMFIPLKMVLIGIDPYPYHGLRCFPDLFVRWASMSGQPSLKPQPDERQRPWRQGQTKVGAPRIFFK